jgi:hypothetical protein
MSHKIWTNCTQSDTPYACSLASSVVGTDDLESMRRSLAIGGSLGRADTEHLIDICQTLLAQRAAIAAVLGQLGPSWRDARAALNELARIVRQA